MSDELPIPRARYEVMITIKTCEWADVVPELCCLVEHIQEHGEESKIVGSRSWLYVQIDKSVTPESYKAKLLEWFNARKKKSEVTP